MDELVKLPVLKLALIAVIVCGVLCVKYWKDLKSLAKSVFKKKDSEPEANLPFSLAAIASAYIRGMILTIQFGDVHARKEDRMGEALLAVVNQVRSLPSGQRGLIIDLTSSGFINSMFMMHLITLLNEVIRNNGLMLTIRIPDSTYNFRAFGEQLRIMARTADHILIEGGGT